MDVRELRRLGAIELSQLVEEVPPIQRTRVNRWLNRYAVATRLICTQNEETDNRTTLTNQDHRYT